MSILNRKFSIKLSMNRINQSECGFGELETNENKSHAHSSG